MKKYIYILPLAALLACVSCQEEGLMTFGQEHHIYFEKFYNCLLYTSDAADE